MAKPNYSFEKRRKELAKKKKQEEKLRRKLEKKKKNAPVDPDVDQDSGAQPDNQ